jgi:GH25 family lysozyme M1 (1,4-beta-N-acetylmuramidase)
MKPRFGHPRLSFAKLLAAVFLYFPAFCSVVHACDNGADVEDDKCRFFARFVDGVDGGDDTRLNKIRQAAANGEENPPPVRSYALIVDVNVYPKFQEYNDRRLNPAFLDMINLIGFFTRQKFEEIIVLENGAATKENIEYFLETYLGGQVKNQPSRVVFAYSGHGGPGNTADEPGKMILSNAKSLHDSTATYKLYDLYGSMRVLAGQTFHFLALMGSCNSGGIFSGQPTVGPNSFRSNKRGAHAITATTAYELAYAISEDQGSLFFDALVTSVESGTSSLATSGSIQSEVGLLATGGGTVRASNVQSAIDSAMENQINPITHEAYPEVEIGKILPNQTGGFFFLVPEKFKSAVDFGPVKPTVIGYAAGPVAVPASPDIIAFGEEADVPTGADDALASGFQEIAPLPSQPGTTQLTPDARAIAAKRRAYSFRPRMKLSKRANLHTSKKGGGQDQNIVTLPETSVAQNLLVPQGMESTGSAIVGRPDLKVFNDPDQYDYLGIDVSHHNGVLNWAGIKADGNSFAYIKSTEGGTFVDKMFDQNWHDSIAAKIIPGAYHVWNFCRDAKSQFDNIVSNVPNDSSALPIAVDLEWFNDGPLSPKQSDCRDVAKIRQQLHTLLSQIDKHYHKNPIIFAHSDGKNQLLGDEFNDYALWLQDWTKDGADAKEGARLAGTNPWTIWQYAGDAQTRGKNGIDLNVFFGGKEQFDIFRQTGRNISRDLAVAK